MNYTRVNLLKKSERRYQGAVSKQFIMMIMIVAPVLILALLGMILTLQYRSTKSQLETGREVWSDMEPKLELFKEEMKGWQANQEAMAYFESWEETQPSFLKLLKDMQKHVPAQIQFTRLSIKTEDSQKIFTDPEEVRSNYTMMIEGLSQGRNSEYNVIELRKKLLASETVLGVFDAVKLASMRKRLGSDDLNLREFRLEAEQISGGAR